MVTIGGGILGRVSSELRNAIFCSPSPEEIAERALQEICLVSRALGNVKVVLETVLNGASHGYQVGESISWIKEAGEFYGKIPVHLPNKNVPPAAELAAIILPIARIAAASFALARGEKSEVVEKIGGVPIEKLPRSVLPSGRKTYHVEIAFEAEDRQHDEIVEMRSIIADEIEAAIAAESGWEYEGSSSGAGTAEIGYTATTQRVAKRIASAASSAAKRLTLPVSIEVTAAER